MHEVMINFFFQYAYIFLGFFILAVYVSLAVYYFRVTKRDDQRPRQFVWFMLLGPIALLKRRQKESGRKGLFTRREELGWMFVILLMLTIIVWKIAT
jgi:hypothetical protein